MSSKGKGKDRGKGKRLVPDSTPSPPEPGSSSRTARYQGVPPNTFFGNEAVDPRVTDLSQYPLVDLEQGPPSWYGHEARRGSTHNASWPQVNLNSASSSSVAAMPSTYGPAPGSTDNTSHPSWPQRDPIFSFHVSARDPPSTHGAKSIPDNIQKRSPSQRDLHPGSTSSTLNPSFKYTRTIDPNFIGAATETLPRDPDTLFDTTNILDSCWTFDTLRELSLKLGPYIPFGSQNVKLHFETFKEMHKEKQANPTSPLEYWKIERCMPDVLPYNNQEDREIMYMNAEIWTMQRKAARIYERILSKENMKDIPAVETILVMHGYRPDPTIYQIHCGFAGFIAKAIASLNLLPRNRNIHIIHQTPPLRSLDPNGPGRPSAPTATTRLLGVPESHYPTTLEFTVENVLEPFGYLRIDNHTFVIYFDDHQPFRQILGGYLIDRRISPACLICPDIEEDRPNNEEGQVLERDPKSVRLRSIFIDTDYYAKHDWIKTASFAKPSYLKDHAHRKQTVITDMKVYLRTTNQV